MCVLMLSMMHLGPDFSSFGHEFLLEHVERET